MLPDSNTCEAITLILADEQGCERSEVVPFPPFLSRGRHFASSDPLVQLRAKNDGFLSRLPTAR